MQHELYAKMREATERSDPVIREELDRIAVKYRMNSQ
jgi:hypothetical protein